MSAIYSKKSQTKLIYACLVFLLFLHSIQDFSVRKQFSHNGTENDVFCDAYSQLDVIIIRLSQGTSFGTSTIMSFELMLSYQNIMAEFSSLNLVSLHSLVENQISQITEMLLDSGELFGVGKATNGVLLLIGTISFDYQKYQDSKKLSSRNRNRLIIKETINDHPGINLREIQRATNLAMGVIQYHIRSLESGEIESIKLGKCKHFFDSGSSFSVKEKVWFSLIQNKNIKNILNLLIYDQYTQKEISYITGNSKSLISYYIKNLVSNGIIEKENNLLRITEDYIDLKRN